VPAGQLRKVTGRVIVPAGYKMASEEYSIIVNIGIDGTLKSERLHPDEKGCLPPNPCRLATTRFASLFFQRT